ncbi:MAG: hypothetical protein BGO55_24695 [Sphingobacteriales bacterium 50-39]|nr:hypothetical protein [Sphingobacteriales bacterium]OJW58487.1 MAG: hypothetical protein BGO55_24695 [Sphingobacteriales bacterium 50-39]
MKFLYCLILLGLTSLAAPAQSFIFPKFENTVPSVSDLIPVRWHIKDSVSGDLNKDGRADLAPPKDGSSIFPRAGPNIPGATAVRPKNR